MVVARHWRVKEIPGGVMIEPQHPSAKLPLSRFTESEIELLHHLAEKTGFKFRIKRGTPPVGYFCKRD